MIDYIIPIIKEALQRLPNAELYISSSPVSTVPVPYSHITILDLNSTTIDLNEAEWVEIRTPIKGNVSWEQLILHIDRYLIAQYITHRPLGPINNTCSILLRMKWENPKAIDAIERLTSIGYINAIRNTFNNNPLQCSIETLTHMTGQYLASS